MKFYIEKKIKKRKLIRNFRGLHSHKSFSKHPSEALRDASNFRLGGTTFNQRTWIFCLFLLRPLVSISRVVTVSWTCLLSNYTVIWLKYCRYDVKQYSINQSINQLICHTFKSASIVVFETEPADPPLPPPLLLYWINHNCWIWPSWLYLFQICAPGYQNPLKNNDTSGSCVYFENDKPSTISQLLIRIPSPDTSYSFSWSLYGFSITAGMVGLPVINEKLSFIL